MGMGQVTYEIAPEWLGEETAMNQLCMTLGT